MENKKLVAPIIVLLCILATISMTAPTSNADYKIAAQSFDIYMSPANGTQVQGLFNVSIWVSGLSAQNIGGVQAYIGFDDTLVNATRWFEPTDNSSYLYFGMSSSALPAPPNPGYVHLSAGSAQVIVGVNKGGMPPVAPWGHAPGLVCIVEFNTTSPIGTTLNLQLNHGTDTFILDETATPVADVQVDDAQYSVIPEFPFVYALLALIGLTAMAVAVRRKAFPKPEVKNL